ncbi:unnamed protein product, partial [Lymnaea stagnalis]
RHKEIKSRTPNQPSRTFTMDHRTLLRICFYQLIFFTVLVNVIAGNDVITFNQDKDLSAEENVDTLLETEQFIKVDGRKAPQTKHANDSARWRDSPALKQVANSGNEASSSLKLSPLPSTQTHESSSAQAKDSPAREPVLARSNCSHTLRDGSKHAPKLTWDDLSMVSEHEDDFLPDMDYTFLPLNGEYSEPLLSRSRRQAPSLEPGSGQALVKGEITLGNGTLTPQQETEGSSQNLELKRRLAEALMAFLKTMTNTEYLININALRSGSIIIDFELLTPEDIYNSTVLELASAFSTLLNRGALVVGNSTYYSVQNALLKDDSLPYPLPVICYLCKNYQSCTKGSDGTWIPKCV